MNLSQGKVFEKPDAGQFLGTIIDVVELANKPTQYGPKDKVRIFYVIGPLGNDGKYALDSENKPFRVMREFNASMAESSKLFEFVGTVLQAAPPMLNTVEELAQLLIGRSNFLFLTKIPNPKKAGDFFTNIAGLGPVPAGMVAPPIPKDFVRAKDQVKKTFTPGQYVQPQQAPAVTAPTVTTPAPAAPAAVAVGGTQPPATPTYRTF